jgi:3',5'-cyclic AMP phosphodiesterase CpdA
MRQIAGFALVVSLAGCGAPDPAGTDPTGSSASAPPRAAAVTEPASSAQGVSPSGTGAVAQEVVAIAAPRVPLPAEAESADVSRFSFIVYGDTRGRRDGEDLQHEHGLVVESMLRTIAALEAGPDPVRFVLQSGDAVLDGKNAGHWNVSFVALINRITQEAGLPYFLAPGNHDVTGAADLEAPGRRQGLNNYLSAVAGLIPPDGATRRLEGYPTYAFGYGNTFVLALDSNIAEDATQLAWAAEQLEGLDRERYVHVVAFFHHPAYSSGPHGASRVERPTATVRARWMPLFRQHGVDLIFTGHEHLFEHWTERYRDQSGQARRMDQIVSGGGGAPLYPYRGEPDLTAYLAAAAAESVEVTHVVRPGPDRGDNPHHYVVVHVNGRERWMEVVGVDWGRDFRPYRSARTTLADPAGGQ